MKKIFLPNVTLLAVDCTELDLTVVISEVCQRHMEFGAVKILSHMPSDCPYVIPIDRITSVNDYCLFILEHAYKYVDTEYALIFQNDGFILNPFAWKDQFLRYDYIGAPWWYDDDCNVGNGGFSLRTRALMEHVALDPNIVRVHPEDDCICRQHGKYLKRLGFTFAPDAIAGEFSIEQGKWNGQFGFHKTDISDWEIERFLDKDKYPQYIDMFYQIYRPSKV